jgi:UDP-N-acetylglucosamine 3-dehydrogenase
MHVGSYVSQLKGLDGIQITGLFDDDPTRQTERAAQFGVPEQPTLTALLESCDAVCICSENVKHKPFTLTAAAAGKHILCEKPLATNPDDARAMVDACEQAGVKLLTAFPCRFSPAFEHLKAAVEAGEMGEVLAARCTNQGMCPGGWFVQKELSGGGAVMDHTVHVTDLLRVLLGDDVQEVYCESGNGLLHGDFDDTGFLTLTFDKGVFATLDASWSRPKSFPTWGNVTMAVIGTRGVIELDMFTQESALYSDKTGRVSYQGWGSDIDRGLVAAFLSELRGERTPIATGLDGLRAVEVVEAAYKSIETAQPAVVLRR